MTDLQVKYQELQHDKAVLEEDKRVHDAQIAKTKAETVKVRGEVAKVRAETKKLTVQYKILSKDLDYYDADKVAGYIEQGSKVFKNITSGVGDVLKGVGSIIPG